MKQKPELWCLKSPEGELKHDTLAEFNPTTCDTHEDAVWFESGFSHVSLREGSKWTQRFWKRWKEAIASAKRRGWKFVKVKLIESKK